MNLLQYLKEKEEYFYPQDEIKEIEDIPNNSDPILNADEFMYSNSDPLSYYARGNGFNLEDNQGFYEVVKLVKDMTDKHIYTRDMTWRVDIAHRKAIFTFKLGNDKIKEANDFFLHGVNQYVLAELWKRYGPLYQVETEFLKNTDGQNIAKITVKKQKGELEKIQKKIDTRFPDSASFTTKTSITQM